MRALFRLLPLLALLFVTPALAEARIGLRCRSPTTTPTR